MSLQPDSAEVLNNLGFELARMDFHAEAVPLLEKAVRIQPDFPLAQNNLAWVRSEFAKRN